MSLNESSHIEGTLFNIPESEQRQNGPVMKGDFNIRGESGKIQGFAWVKESTDPKKPKSNYLSFQLELDRNVKFYGAIFRTEDKKSDKAPDYFGTLNLTTQKGGPTLRIAGWKRKSNEKKTPFISVVIEPPRQQGEEQSSGGQQQQRRESRQQASDLPI